MGCNTCSCHSNMLLCTKMACFYPGRSKDMLRTKKEIIASKNKKKLKDLSKLSDEEFYKLPALPHQASQCVPNNLYRVDCNACYCEDEEFLVCENHMCIDESTTRQIAAAKKSGKPCQESFVTNDCIKCLCLNGTTKCAAISDCKIKDEIQMLAEIIMQGRYTFDFTKQECVPHVVYKDKCNKCHCQPDKTLRCTRKLCLNHKQAKLMEQQKEYLQEHGL